MSEVVTYLDSEAFFVFKMRAKLASVLRLATLDWDSADGVKLMADKTLPRRCPVKNLSIFNLLPPC